MEGAVRAAEAQVRTCKAAEWYWDREFLARIDRSMAWKESDPRYAPHEKAIDEAIPCLDDAKKLLEETTAREVTPYFRTSQRNGAFPLAVWRLGVVSAVAAVDRVK